MASVIDSRPFTWLTFLTKQQRKKCLWGSNKCLTSSKRKAHLYLILLLAVILLMKSTKGLSPKARGLQTAISSIGGNKKPFQVCALKPTSAVSEIVFCACTSLFEKKRFSLTRKNASMTIFTLWFNLTCHEEKVKWFILRNSYNIRQNYGYE